MALKIRLRQQGCNNCQTFRVVVADARCKRDGKYVEKLGYYLPEQKENNCTIDAERLAYWLSQGAVMSQQVESLAKTLAPSVIKEYTEKKVLIQAKKAAKRRASGKETEVKAAAPKKAAKKTSAKK
ncbi:MAG: 30S ribosomal protein S16 [Chlamydiae bacterium]|nr:30S ribosomal protein S16 [Chlamydiota bacterium]